MVGRFPKPAFHASEPVTYQRVHILGSFSDFDSLDSGRIFVQHGIRAWQAQLVELNALREVKLWY